MDYTPKFRLIPFEERQGLICHKCNSNKSVKYINLINLHNYCNVCILTTI